MNQPPLQQPFNTGRALLLNPDLKELLAMIGARKCRPVRGLSSVVILSGETIDSLEMRILNLAAIAEVREIRKGHCRVGYQTESIVLEGDAADQLVSLLATSSVFWDGRSTYGVSADQRRRAAMQNVLSWPVSMFERLKAWVLGVRA